jgi:integrase
MSRRADSFPISKSYSQDGAEVSSREAIEMEKASELTSGKPRRARGTGGLWRVGRIWWMQYQSRGQRFRESTGTTDEEQAKRALRRRLREVAADVFRPDAQRIAYEDLRAAYISDYATNGRKSLRFDKEGKPKLDKVARLDKFFAGRRASEIDSDQMRKFTAALQAEGLENGTINRSLSALRRMFHLAKRDQKLRDIPYFPMLKEAEPRQGFFEPQEYVALRNALPDYLRVPLAIGYYTGMRRGEILKLKWKQVDFIAGFIRLNAGETKNNKGRNIPIIADLRTVVREQHAKRQPGCELVCFQVNLAGKAVPVGDFRKVWYNRCVKMGLGKMVQAKDLKTGEPLFQKLRGPRSKPKPKLIYEGMIFHDLRRTGVRNLVRAGVPERDAMEITGHKTRSVFQRYNIVDERDAVNAGRKLEKYISEQFGASLVQIDEPEASTTTLPN